MADPNNLDLKSVEIHKLILDSKNARKHNPKGLEALKKSLKRFGQQKPIVIDKQMRIVAGHGTVAAAEELGWREIDCVVTTLKAKDVKAFAIADNRTAELSEWDMGNLGEALQELREFNFDITDCGFDVDEIAGLGQPDDVEPKKKKTKEVNFTASEEGGNGAKKGVKLERAELPLQTNEFILQFTNDDDMREFMQLVASYRASVGPETAGNIVLGVLKQYLNDLGVG